MTPEFVPWSQWFPRWPRQFKQGQHVTVIGPTDCGKTSLVTQLIKPRTHVVTFGVKHRDDSMSRLLKDKEEGWKRIQTWNDRGKADSDPKARLMLWPKEDDIERVASVHKEAFTHAIKDVYKRGSYCLWLDEMRVMADHYGMKQLLTMMYVAARSNKISIVGNTQRPAWVPLEAYSQAGHLIMFRNQDARDLVRIGSLNGANAKEVAAIVSDLPFRHFLHVDLTNGKMETSTLTM